MVTQQLGFGDSSLGVSALTLAVPKDGYGLFLGNLSLALALPSGTPYSL